MMSMGGRGGLSTCNSLSYSASLGSRSRFLPGHFRAQLWVQSRSIPRLPQHRTSLLSLYARVYAGMQLQRNSCTDRHPINSKKIHPTTTQSDSSQIINHPSMFHFRPFLPICLSIPEFDRCTRKEKGAGFKEFDRCRLRRRGF